jgi:hypothetical protein
MVRSEGITMMTMARRSLVIRLLALAALAAWSRHRLRDWGSTSAERAQTLPGDELIPDPADVITRAVNIHAPAETVWQWLVQFGQGRGGMYSYDALENALGLGIHSADDIHPEWQTLAVGDLIRLVPERWPAMPGGYALGVAQINRGHYLVLRQQRPEQPWNAVWSFHIVPDGPAKSRLLSRSRSERGNPLMSLITQLMDPITMVMTRRMLVGIKQRAERSHVDDLIEQSRHPDRHQNLSSGRTQTLGA